MTRQVLITVPTPAVITDGHHKKVVTLPTDSVVDVPVPLSLSSGLVRVIFNGEAILMFAEDIR